MKKFAKILSILCAVALIVSCISVGFVASAAQVTFFTSDTAGGYPSENFLANSDITISARGIGPKGEPNDVELKYSGRDHANKSMLVDGDYGSNNTPGSDLLNASNNSSETVKQTDAYLQYTFDLNGSVSNPTMFIYTAHNITSVAGQYISVHYEIFASDYLYDLYDAKNSIYLHSADKGQGVQHVLDLTNANLTNIKYLGARFYHRPYSDKSMHAAEFGLCGGTYTPEAVEYTESMDKPADGTTYPSGNHLTSNGTVTYVVDGAVSGSGVPNAIYYNGAPDGGYDQAAAYGFSKQDNSPFQTDTYMQYEYSFDYPISNPEKFFVAAGTGWDNMASQRWTLFASSDKETLYDEDSIVYEYLSAYGGNANGFDPQPMEQEVDISGLGLKNVKYFAIRFYHRSYSARYYNAGQMLFLSELGLYGGTSILTENAKWSVDEENRYNYGDNRLFGSTLSYKAIRDGAPVEFKEGSTPEMSTLTNNIVTHRNQMQTAGGWNNNYTFSNANENTYIEVTFNLEKPVTDPEKFLIAHDQPGYGGSPAANVCQWYEVFASDSEEDLYSKSFFEFKKKGATSEEQILDISGMDLGEVKYVGIRFYYLANGCFALPSEIAIYGGEVPADPFAEIKLGASVFNSKAGENANDIQYRTSLEVAEGATLVDMGIISAFNVNIIADEAFAGDYAAYLKTEPATASKVSAGENMTNENLYFHITNSGKAGDADYSGYKVITIAYVTVEVEGVEYTYYSNVVDKGSKQISRNQARDYYGMDGEYKEIADTAYAGYDFTDSSTDINKVREYVEAINAMKAQ